MKKITILALCVAAVFMVLFCFAVSEYNKVSDKLEIVAANVKAYDNLLSDSEKKNEAFQFTINQMNSLQDSIIQELNKTKKELKIKDSKIKSLQYMASSFSKADTVVLKDTIFKEPAFSLDTLLRDDWYSLQLGLRYPAAVAVKPDFKSEKHVIVSTKRETIEPPKKFFLLRWFQKRHQVICVDIVEKNPYVIDEDSRYIEIVK